MAETREEMSPSWEREVRFERLNAAFGQVPIAVLVTVVNAVLLVAVMTGAGEGRGSGAWLAATAAVAAARLASWRAWRRAAPAAGRIAGWELASVAGALAAGALWGGGAVLLLPRAEIYQLFWAFLLAGMCAGASALHYVHLPSLLAFMLPAGLPLAVRFGLDGSGRHGAAAAMIAVFLAALILTARRSHRHFGETVRLRLDLARRTRELDASNARLRMEMAERRNTEESLRHAQKMEAVGQLTGGIAHDFNNLLTAVLGNLALLRKRLPADDAKVAQLLDNAVQGAERGASLTQRLLAFGRRQTLRPEIVRLQALVPGMSALLLSSLGTQTQVAMRIPRTLAPVQVDANQLELAVLNLVVNARDAMPEGGRIVIAAREEQGYVVLSVSDTGGGMDEATLARAMEPFFTTKGVGKGTGLGLAMVHGFVAQSGGRLVLDSRMGDGTIAEMWLPRPAESAAAAAPAPAPAALPADRRCTILVVDDDPLVLASTISMLEDLGHTAIGAGSGAEALGLVHGGTRFDLVVTDFAMPGMTGVQLSDELHRTHPDLPVMLATGYAQLQGAGETLVRLAKPFGQEALARAIGRCLGSVPTGLAG